VVGEGEGGEGVLMRFLSWNVRGLGGAEKRREVRLLVGEKVPFILCIQETKLQSCDDLFCASLWGASTHSYSFYSSTGASRGLLTMWDTNEVQVWDSAGGRNFLMIHGNFVQSNEEFYLFNVYAPCDMLAKQALWDCLTHW